MTLDRRRFLAFLAGARAARASLLPEEFKKRLRGPVVSVPTVYTADFRVDPDGIRKVINTGVKAGAQVFALTAGNSQYDRLTYEEIKQLTRVFVEAVAGRGVTIAATGGWWTGQAVDYARYAEAVGADAVQVMLPSYGDPDMLYDHFRQVAAATSRGIVLHGQVPLPLLKRLMAIESIVAYKEEYPPAYSVEVFALYGKRLSLFAGGQKSRFLMFHPYGMQAYYSTFATFAPEIPRRFWSAVETGDLETARQAMLRYDVPFFQRWSHAFWRATLEHFGIAKRHLRPPDRGFTDDQMKELRAFYDSLGLSRAA
jgi:4-hydroxy-tetrahydrodipicolinate synthase